MVRIGKVYTRQGDKGTTRLAGGQEVPKTAARIEAYGTVDELNAAFGLALESLRGEQSEALAVLGDRLRRIQNELFDLGSQLAVLPEDRRENTPVIRDEDTERLEAEIDGMNEELPRLTSFILPGGGELSARLHLARTICRRAERNLLRLAAEEDLDGTEVPYVNRLGDWLFVAARMAAAASGIEETLWEPGGR